MRFYIVVLDRDPAKSYKAFQEAFVAHPRIYRWAHYLTHGYVIGTDLSVSELSNHVTKALQTHSLRTNHLALRVDLHERQGRLSKDAWEWFQRNEGLDDE